VGERSLRHAEAGCSLRENRDRFCRSIVSRQQIECGVRGVADAIIARSIEDQVRFTVIDPPDNFAMLIRFLKSQSEHLLIIHANAAEGFDIDRFWPGGQVVNHIEDREAHENPEDNTPYGAAFGNLMVGRGEHSRQ